MQPCLELTLIFTKGGAALHVSKTSQHYLSFSIVIALFILKYF